MWILLMRCRAEQRKGKAKQHKIHFVLIFLQLKRDADDDDDDDADDADDDAEDDADDDLQLFFLDSKFFLEKEKKSF